MYRKYCEKMLIMSPKGVFLVGRLHPTTTESTTESTTPATPAEAVSWLPEGQTSRLIATASISFHPDSRENFKSLQPPDRDAYLCNIAVDPKFRRQGIARQMLGACESLAALQGYKRFYLHVRLGDDAARLLYETSGYTVVDEDSFLVKLTGRTPVCLMVKEFL
jgi:ribosomal protein S18 acetylase RimI-like enzyme